jgi:hypothetical protein
MAKFNLNNIGRTLNAKNLKTIGGVFAGVLAAEAIPMAIQAVGGYDANGTPKINASGPAFDLGTGALAIGLALAYDKKEIAGGIALTKLVKQTYIHLNPQLAKIVGTPLLPAGSNAVINKGASNASLSDTAPAGYKSIKVPLPDGTMTDVIVKDTPGVNDYMNLNDNTEEILGKVNDYMNLNDNTEEILGKVNDYVNLSDYTNLSDSYNPANAYDNVYSDMQFN